MLITVLKRNYLKIMILIVFNSARLKEEGPQTQATQAHLWHYFNDLHIFSISSHLFSRSSVGSFIILQFFCFVFVVRGLHSFVVGSSGWAASSCCRRRFDQGDIDFYSLRALHYHIAQLQFAVRVSLMNVTLPSSTSSSSMISSPALLLLLMGRCCSWLGLWTWISQLHEKSMRWGKKFNIMAIISHHINNLLLNNSHYRALGVCV